MSRRLLLITLTVLSCSWTVGLSAQSVQSGEGSSVHLKAGVGFDYWATNYSGKLKGGPAAWVDADLWRGLGVQIEGHSLIQGDLPQYKYFAGEGGLIYTLHRWEKVEPFAKAELGFAGLSYPRPRRTSHDTRTVWAVGGGLEYHTWANLWTRADYTYEGFPDFLSYVTLQKHTLNPTGVTIGLSYHLW